MASPPLALSRKSVGIAVGLILFALPWLITFDALSPAGHRVLSIFLLAIVLWITEAIPLHATAVLIILLEIVLISDKALIAIPPGFKAPAYTQFYNAMANPVLMLFLGGFFIAHGAEKFQVDRVLTRLMLKPFGTSPGRILLGLMLITALLSMFMSNTATTATMMAVVLPIISQMPKENRMRAALALCIPVAANIGGMGTPVGTPPNAIAVGAIAQTGHSVSFVAWMLMTMPFMIATLIGAWALIILLFARKAPPISLDIPATFDRSRPAIILYLTFLITLGLWLTEPLHGIESYVVGFLPVVVLLCTGVFTTRDLKEIEWHVLWLVAGGIALGTGVAASGLDKWMIGLVHWDQFGPAAVVAGLFLAALALGTVISHSATANLLIPIGMGLATSGVVDVSPVRAAIFIAIGSSLAMALPISTPPNAIAYSTGAVQTRDMVLVGLGVAVIGTLLYVVIAPPIWQAFGLLPT